MRDRLQQVENRVRDSGVVQARLEAEGTQYRVSLEETDRTRVERFDRRGTEPFEPFRTIRILSK